MIIKWIEQTAVVKAAWVVVPTLQVKTVTFISGANEAALDIVT